MEKVIKISIDAEEAYDKNQHPLKIKILKKIGIEEKFNKVYVVCVKVTQSCPALCNPMDCPGIFQARIL